MTTAEIALIVTALSLLIVVGGIIYRAGSKLAELTTTVKPLAEAKIPERLAVVEAEVARHSAVLEAAFDVVPHADRH